MSTPPVVASRGWSARAAAVCLCALSLWGWVIGCGVGSTGWASPDELWRDPVVWQIVIDIRLPRSLGAWAGGALLALAGAIAQGLFRNPLADPYLLGSASGASLGWMVGLLWLGSGAASLYGLQHLGLTGAAFVGAWAAVLLTLALARGVQHTVRLLLAGVVVGVMLGALASLLSLWRPALLQGAQGFMLGSTASVGWSSVVLMAAVLVLCSVCAWAAARVLDVLSLGARTAQSLGLPMAPWRALLVSVLALATATAVAQMGLVAFVGLAAPHAVRALAATTHRWRLPLSTLMGGVLLLWADLLARSLWAPQELPVGLLTAVLGGGYLLWLMHRQSVREGA